MDTYTAIGIAEGFIEAENEQQIIDAWQHLVDTGIVWQMQGWFGRTATHLIEEGVLKYTNEQAIIDFDYNQIEEQWELDNYKEIESNHIEIHEHFTFTPPNTFNRRIRSTEEGGEQ